MRQFIADPDFSNVEPGTWPEATIERATDAIERRPTAACGARYYHPELPRFISPDPVGGKPEIPMSWNKYLYCRNDPMNRFDPDGMADYLILIGDPGLGAKNVGRNFERLAETRTAQLEGDGHCVQSLRVSSVPDISTAMLNSPQIDGGLIYYGHGSGGGIGIAPGEQSGIETNLQPMNIDELPTDVLLPGATVELHGCNTAVGGEDSIAQTVANHLGATTNGYTAGMEFTNVQGQLLPAGSRPPETGPLYPVTAGEMVSVEPNPEPEGTN